MIFIGIGYCEIGREYEPNRHFSIKEISNFTGISYILRKNYVAHIQVIGNNFSENSILTRIQVKVLIFIIRTDHLNLKWNFIALMLI